MDDKSISPNSETFASMIKVCAKDGLYEEAVRIKTEMELSRTRGDSRIYSALIKVCAKEGRIEEAQQFKEEMQHKGT
eukprot:UN19876